MGTVETPPLSAVHRSLHSPSPAGLPFPDLIESEYVADITMTCEDVKQFKITIPPYEEQYLLANSLKQELADVDNAISLLQGEIDLICEYRTRLITDVVTGKLDVRNVEIPDSEYLEKDESDDSEFDITPDSDRDNSTAEIESVEV